MLNHRTRNPADKEKCGNQIAQRRNLRWCEHRDDTLIQCRLPFARCSLRLSERFELGLLQGNRRWRPSNSRLLPHLVPKHPILRFLASTAFAELVFLIVGDRAAIQNILQQLCMVDLMVGERAANDRVISLEDEPRRNVAAWRQARRRRARPPELGLVRVFQHGLVEAQKSKTLIAFPPSPC